MKSTLHHIGLLRAAYLASALLLFTSFANGQSGVGISPPRAEMSVTAGSQISQTIRIDNPSSTANLLIDAKASDALLAPDGSILWVPPGSHPRSVAPWMDVNPIQFELGPGEWRDISYTVTVPADTEAGTYWTVLFFESSQPQSPEGAAGVGVISRVRVGHTIYVTVGQPTVSGEIIGIRYRQSNSSGAVAVNFHNSGTGLLRLDGRLELRDQQGELVQLVTIADQVSFPGAVHELAFILEEPVARGEYTALAVLDYGASQVILGEATVTVP